MGSPTFDEVYLLFRILKMTTVDWTRYWNKIVNLPGYWHHNCDESSTMVVVTPSVLGHSCIFPLAVVSTFSHLRNQKSPITSSLYHVLSLQVQSYITVSPSCSVIIRIVTSIITLFHSALSCSVLPLSPVRLYHVPSSCCPLLLSSYI